MIKLLHRPRSTRPDAIPLGVRVEQVEALYSYLPVSIAANVLLGGCVWASLAQSVSRPNLVAWTVALALALALRLMAYFMGGRRRLDADKVARWEFLFALGAVATGIVWGISFPILGVASLADRDLWFAYTILIVSGSGIASGGVFVMSYRVMVARLFLGAILIPAFIFFASGGSREWVVAILIAIFAGFLYRSLGVAHSVSLKGMLLRRQAEANAEAARASAQERDAATEDFRMFSEVVPDLLLKLDASGNIVWANRHAQGLLGIDVPNTGTVNIGAFLSEGSRHAFADALDSIPRTGRYVQEVRMRTATGEIPFLVSGAGIYDQDGRLVGVAGVAKDISSLKVVEEQMARAKEMAESASRAKSEFVANMSHEIRTPLNAVIGLSELALDQPLSPQVHTFLSNIRSSGANLLAIVNDILDFSKIEAGKMELAHERFELAAVVELVRTQALMHIQDKDLAVNFRIVPGMPPALLGDEVRLAQVLLNLVGNAVKFTSVGRVDMQVQLISREGTSLVLRFEVRDTGIGMTADQVRGLFQPFTQAESSTTRRFGGTGLGLTICKRLVDLMGGSLDVVSAEGQGSTFSVVLPFSEADSVPADRAPALDHGMAGARFTGRRALLVEDNPVNRLVAEATLKKFGLSVDVAVDGREALAKVTAAPALYDIVFMDVQMPHMDGLEATRRIRRLAGTTMLPIIAMTANAFEQDRASCMAAGMNDFVAKPFEKKDVAAAVARWLQPIAPDASPAS
ncbi:MAG: ATP-binding protein [Rhodocyclaceae bacterium]